MLACYSKKQNTLETLQKWAITTYVPLHIYIHVYIKDKNCTYKAIEKQVARDTQKVKGKDKV